MREVKGGTRGKMVGSKIDQNRVLMVGLFDGFLMDFWVIEADFDGFW